MENDANNVKLPISRLINQRDAMHLLLSPPSKLPSSSRRQHCILGGDISKLSLNELASLLSAMRDEIGAAHSEVSTNDGVARNHKRRRAEKIGNNCHAFLLFVERVVYERFSPDSHPDGYVQKEFKSYFGIHEPSFMAEENIICLAFSISLYAIKQSIRQQKPSSDQDSSDVPDKTTNQPVINTALRIIDHVVTTSKRERVVRMCSTIPANDETYPRDDQAAPITKRQRYQFLLQHHTTRDDIAQTNDTLLGNSTSVIEDLYPQQWRWLTDFRQKYHNQVQEVAHEDTAPVSINDATIFSQQSGNGKLEVRDLCGTPNGLELPVLSNGNVGELHSKDACMDTERSTLQEDIDAKGTDAIDNSVCDEPATKDAALQTQDILSESPPALTPIDELDKKANELRKSLISMPPSDLSHAIDDVTTSIVTLLKKYGDLNGASGIERCGNVINGVLILESEKLCSAPEEVVPLNESLVSSLLKQFLTDATGALRAKAFLKSFVLPLMLQLNPINATKNGRTTQGRPASRLMTSLLATLARDRPIECVESLLAPTLVCELCGTAIQPNRFQCELVARILRGKDAISIPAAALLLEKIIFPSNTTTHKEMLWTEHSMPLVSACLNRQPPLADVVVTRLADRVKNYLLPATEQVMGKSMKFSTIFHVLVAKYGHQLKEAGEVDSLKEASSRLKTFMSKTIHSVLSKL